MHRDAEATPHLTYACDTHYVWIEEDILAGGNWRFQDGCMAVPDRPGLGVEIDEDRVARMAEDYRKCGQTERGDAEYMKTYFPDWVPLRPRW